MNAIEDRSDITSADLPSKFPSLTQKRKKRLKKGKKLPGKLKITNEEIIYWMEKLHGNKSLVAKKFGITYKTIWLRWKSIDRKHKTITRTPEISLMELYDKDSPRLINKKKHPINLRWLDGSDLMRRWEMNAFEIVQLIFEVGLSAYDSYSLSLIKHNSLELTEGVEHQLSKEDFVRIINEPIESQKSSLTRLRFKQTDVQHFEKNFGELLEESKKDLSGFKKKPSPKSSKGSTDISSIGESGTKKKQRTSTLIAEKCRKKAKELWEIYPEIDSTGEMAIHPEIVKIGRDYEKPQRQRWISKVAPPYAKRPGVRPRKRK